MRLGFYDDEGTIAVANRWKRTVAVAEGSGRTQTNCMILAVTNTEITPKSTCRWLATRKYADDEVLELLAWMTR